MLFSFTQILKLADVPPTFTTEIKEIKDEAGDIVDTQLFVVFKDSKLIEAVRYALLL